MDEEIRQKILALLDQHRIMTIATLRPDGWPQATTVGYANDGLTLYFLCGRESQKAANLARDDRVSLTIDHDTPQVMDITGLSMAARATVVDDPAEGEKALRLLMRKSAGLPAPANANAGGCPDLPRDADGDLCAGLRQGVRTHRSRHVRGVKACTYERCSLKRGGAHAPRLATQRPFQIVCRAASGMLVPEKRDRLGVDELCGQVWPSCARAVLSRKEKRDRALPHR